MQPTGRRRARRLGMTVAGVVIMLFVSIVVAGPAGGKGVQSVTITGPGLDRPIEIEMPGPGSQQDDMPPYLAFALIELAAPLFAGSDAELPADPPPRPLKDSYTLTWHMSQPANADAADYTVVQDLYPDASEVPAVYTHPSPYLDDSGGWYNAAPALRDTLAALGVPISGLPTAATDPSGAGAQMTEPATQESWLLPVVATLGLAAGVGLGLALTKRRARHRAPFESMQPAAGA